MTISTVCYEPPFTTFDTLKVVPAPYKYKCNTIGITLVTLGMVCYEIELPNHRIDHIYKVAFSLFSRFLEF